jgi:hypothetical protein
MRVGMICLGALLVSACTSSNPSGQPAPKSLRDLLTRAEIMKSTTAEMDLYQTIRSLRPNFLTGSTAFRSEASRASMAIAVYFDRVRQAGIESLRLIPSSAVAEVRYLDPTTSQNEFGPAASGGALVVKFYKPDEP